ncbi:MAG: GTP cyclohydrolase II [Myxococcales bacterium]|nr:MAG: GTP cyclohydrolase II [Myxococcales bacterium]
MNTRDSTEQSLPAVVAEALARGEMIVLYDDAHPELGGHICCSAKRVDADKINFMITHARGLICLAMSEKRMHALSIPMMVADTPFSRRLAFGASIEASSGVTTGISAADRARTIEVASATDAGPDDIVMPGHVFPLMVRGGGVLVKGGLPEAAVDLVSMAGDGDSAALCTILDDDGEVADRDGVARVAKSFGLEMLCVSDVVADRLRRELVVERVAEREIESRTGGTFRAIVYRNDIDGHEHMALVAGDISGSEPVSVRVHSQCLTGDVLGSTRCDCGDQLELAMERISSEGRGAIVYMNQEGRGIGLANKIRAYALQDAGRDTVEANLELGFKEDLRDYGITAQIIKDLGIREVNLLTNNPQKIEGLELYGVRVAQRTPIQALPHRDNIEYLRTKRAKLGHLLDPAELQLRDGVDDGRES